jgi:hypothetical protein
MALAATIAIVSLIALLAVTTLSLTTRLVQESALEFRDARLEATASYGLASVAPEWQAQGIGGIAVGATIAVAVPDPGNGVSLGVEVTRIDAATFWTVSTATATDGSVRRQNLIVRIRLPDADLLAADDSTNVLTVGGVPVDSIAAEAAASLSPGATWLAADGIIHALGDLEITGGSATGVLIVEGELTVSGPLTYSGIIIVKNGLRVTSTAGITGILRLSGASSGDVLVSTSPDVAQAVLRKALTPQPVRGRAWGEMF